MKSIEELQKLVVQGFTNWEKYGHVNVKEKDGLILFNYGVLAQVEASWTWFERVSRGLIINKNTGEIVARPYDKFFNWNENHIPKPNRRKRQIVSITEKMDGCFLGNTKLNLWDGGTITIREVVSKKLPVILKGMNEEGAVVPTKVVDWFDNGYTNEWLKFELNCNPSEKSGTGKYSNSLIVTPNHSIHVNGEFICAFDVQEGDIVLTNKTNPSDDVIKWIKGGLLGDGSISSPNKGYSFIYQESHNNEQKVITELSEHVLGMCCSSGIKTYYDKKYNSISYYLYSKSYPILKELRNEWYKEDGTKRLPESLDWIDDSIISKWFMDDGCCFNYSDGRNPRGEFFTQSFCKEDVERLQHLLQNRYNIECILSYQKGWTIRIKRGYKGRFSKQDNAEKFWKSIAPYIPVSLRNSKLPEEYRSIPFKELKRGEEEIISSEAKVLSISSLVDNDSHAYFKKYGKKKYDIKTTTSNYFANGILVHNSLGILYRIDNEYALCTRGSFNSDQSKWGTDLLHNIYNLRKLSSKIPDECTLLFEVIVPENRIVVDYGDRQALVLIGARNRFTGEHYDLDFRNDMADYFGFETPRDYNTLIPDSNRSIDYIMSYIKDWTSNQEGLVVEFNNGSFWKFKSPEYCRVHKFLSSINFKNILEAVKDGSIDDILTLVPEHFEEEVNAIVEDIRTTIINLITEIEEKFQLSPKESRKTFAQWVMSTHPELQSYLFARFDEKDLLPVIYKNAFKNRNNKHLICNN